MEIIGSILSPSTALIRTPTTRYFAFVAIRVGHVDPEAAMACVSSTINLFVTSSLVTFHFLHVPCDAKPSNETERKQLNGKRELKALLVFVVFYWYGTKKILS
jgi:succinate dehydrogenase hydrophobic anchor subunit